MKPPYFVEVLARNGDVLHRHQVNALPIRIGRGYDNDFILDDAHSGASHAVVEADAEGRLVLRDLGSRNGSVHHGRRQDSIVMGGDTVVRLGHTRLRVRPSDFAVPPERADTTNHGWEGAAPGLLGLALIAVFSVLENWLSDTESFQLIRYLLVLASGLGAALVWSGLWALANRLFGQHARLGRHLFILGCGLAAFGVWRVVAGVLAYAWSAEVLTGYANLVTLAIASAMLYFHLVTIKPHHPRRFATSCAILLIGGSGLMLMTNLQSSGRLSDELYMSVLLPPSLRHSPDHSVAEFMGDAAQLKTRVDAGRAASAKNSADGDDDDSE